MANKNIKPRWKKGESGNPKGRPKGVPTTKTRMLRLLQLVQKKANPVTGEMEEFSIMEQMDMAIIAKALKGDIRAYEQILDRMEGKAVQTIQQEGATAIRIIRDGDTNTTSEPTP